MRSKNTRFSKQKYNIKNEPPNKPPPFGHGPKRNNPLREVLDGFPAPSFARFGLGKNSEPFLRTSLDRLGAPPFALQTCTNFEQSRAKSVGRLHLAPLRSGDWVQKTDGAPVRLAGRPRPTPLRGTRSLFNLEAPSCAICWTRFSYPPSDLTPLRLFGKSEYSVGASTGLWHSPRGLTAVRLKPRSGGSFPGGGTGSVLFPPWERCRPGRSTPPGNGAESIPPLVNEPPDLGSRRTAAASPGESFGPADAPYQAAAEAEAGEVSRSPVRTGVGIHSLLILGTTPWVLGQPPKA